MACAPGVGVDSHGDVFVIHRNERVWSTPFPVELDADGNVVDSFGSYGKEHGQFRLGHDIAVARDGSVYVAEGAGKRLQKFIRRSP